MMGDILLTAGTERRDRIERRRLSWRTVVFGYTRSRRRESRRAADTEVTFIDWHHPWLFFLSVGTMLLSCVDAFLTLRLIDAGMFEANPVMAAAMGLGTGWFVGSKMALTGMGVMLLVFVARTQFLNRFRTGLILTSCFSLYCCLICYELLSLFRLL